MPGVEARGFIFAPVPAYAPGAGFVPVGKPRKLPAGSTSVSCELEYGTDTPEVHEDAISKGTRVLIADDQPAPEAPSAAGRRWGGRLN